MNNVSGGPQKKQTRRRRPGGRGRNRSLVRAAQLRLRLVALRAASRLGVLSSALRPRLERARAGVARLPVRVRAAGLIVLALAVAVPVLAASLGGGSGARDAKAHPDTFNGNQVNMVSLPSPALPPVLPVEPTPTPLLLQKGMVDAVLVPGIQERLMELGYMDYDQPTDYFGPGTRDAVELFQRIHNMEMTGILDGEAYDLLMSEAAQKYFVSVGVTGEDVYELQVRLRELGYINKATSYFGDETQAAVIRFQQLNNLDVDGTVGEQTREMLYSENVKANYMAYGDVSEELKPYQARLIKLAYLTGEADGVYGNGTKAAVRSFQSRNGLIADGYLGPQTRELLLSSRAEANMLTIGDSGSDVEYVQRRLKELNYFKDKVTSYFGEVTEYAVRLFQKQNGLSVDGKVGRKTLEALRSGSAKKYSAGGPTPAPGTASTPKPDGGGSAGANVPAAATVENFLAVARSKLGSPYRRGAKGPDKFDCSGFVYWCLNQVGVKQSYLTSKSWRSVGKYQKLSSLSSVRAGDVVVFYGHVGIALSNDSMIDASSGDGKVRTCNLQSAYWKKNFICAYRIF